MAFYKPLEDPVIVGLLTRTQTREETFPSYLQKFANEWKGKPITAYHWYVHLKKCHAYVRSRPAESEILSLDLTLLPVYIRWKLAEWIPHRVAELLFDTYAYEHDSHKGQNTILIQNDRKGYIYGPLTKLVQNETQSPIQALVRRYVLTSIFRLPTELEASDHTQNFGATQSY